MTITDSELREHLLGAGIPSPFVFVSDTVYRPPSLSYVLDTFGPWFRDTMFRLNFVKWQAESADCDDWSLLFAALLRIAHKNTPGNEGSAIPVGTVWYTSPQGRHAIVFVLCDDNEVHFIEPQTQREVALTGPERTSAWPVFA